VKPLFENGLFNETQANRQKSLPQTLQDRVCCNRHCADCNFTWLFKSVAYTVYRLRDHPFMNEVVYVWNLKKQLNLIYRKQHKIEPLIEGNNIDAMVIMNYMYQGSKQLYELDDNTITMSDLAIKTSHLNTKLEEKELQLTTEDYYSGLLARF
jgi:hypothetical protein